MKIRRQTIVITDDHKICFYTYISEKKANGLRIVHKYFKYGVIDNTGKLLCKLKYDYIFDFCNGFAPVEKNCKYGFININGEEILKPEYDFVWNFEDGVAKIYKNNEIFLINEKGHFIEN